MKIFIPEFEKKDIKGIPGYLTKIQIKNRIVYACNELSLDRLTIEELRFMLRFQENPYSKLKKLLNDLMNIKDDMYK